MEAFVTLTDSSGALLTGKTAYTQLKVRRVADEYLLDWNDLTFKALGWINIYTSLDEIDVTNLPGQYNKVISTSNWPDGFYQTLVRFDDGVTVQNFSGQEYIEGSVTAAPSTPIIVGVGVGGDTLRANIATHLNRTDLTSQIATFCTLAVAELEDSCFWFQLASTTVTTAAAVGYVALPTGFIKEVKDGFRDTSGVSLEKKDWATIDQWQRYSAGAGEPAHYAVADKFYLYSIPDAIYALPLQYYKKLGFPSGGFDNAWTTDVWDLTFWCALKHAWIYMDNPTNQSKCEKEMIKCLSKYKSRSGKITGKGRVTYREF